MTLILVTTLYDSYDSQLSHDSHVSHMTDNITHMFLT